MTIETWIQILVYCTSFGSLSGVVLTRLGNLEKMLSEYNKIGERLALTEQSVKSAHKRLDELKEKIDDLKN